MSNQEGLNFFDEWDKEVAAAEEQERKAKVEKFYAERVEEDEQVNESEHDEVGKSDTDDVQPAKPAVNRYMSKPLRTSEEYEAMIDHTYMEDVVQPDGQVQAITVTVFKPQVHIAELMKPAYAYGVR